MAGKQQSLLILGGALGCAVMGLVVRAAGLSSGVPVARAALLGVGVIGASLLLTWAAELAQLDMSPAVAIAGLALVAVLPEYVVGATFAWRGGRAFAHFGATCQTAAQHAAGQTSPCNLALANMLGANRLLIGVGWSLVVLVAWRRTRTRHGTLLRGVVLDREHAVELAFLAIASVWCFTLPLRHTVGIVDTVVLFAVFGGYALRLLRAPAEPPELEGVAGRLAALAPNRRRLAAIALAILAAITVFTCADAFADALIASGRVLGISDTFLIQWLAPLASEAPELMVATIYAWRLRAQVGLGALVSSKVNQWTVLIGSLPVAFALASSSAHGLPLGSGPRQELALTAAQSLFGVAVLGNMEVSTAEAISLFTLFTLELVIGTALPSTRGLFTAVYVVSAIAILGIKRHDTATLLRDGFRTPYPELRRPSVEP